MDYVSRFVRLAARYEEELFNSTKIGYPSAPFTGGPAVYAQLGSGLIFTDEVAGSKEINASASRIEAWRHTKMYEYYSLVRSSVQGMEYLNLMTILWFRISKYL